MIRKLYRMGLLSLAIVLMLAVVALHFVTKRYEESEKPELYGAAFTQQMPDGAPEGLQKVLLTGKSLYRLNRLYVNGKRMNLRYYTALSYSEAVLGVEPELLHEGDTIAVGKAFALTLGEVFRSNAVPIEPDKEPRDYRVRILDENGNGVAGCMVNFCTDTTCKPVVTNESGLAVFEGEPAVYHVQVLRIPKGYAVPEEWTTTADYETREVWLQPRAEKE